MTTINVKIGLYGDSDVGKSTLITYLQTNNFKNSKDITIGVDYYTICKKINDIDIKFQIWDTAGQERYNSIITKYYTVNIPIFIFDISNIQSFNNLNKWVDLYHKHRRYNSIFMYCIGNKTDLVNKVNLTDINTFCNKYNMMYFNNSYINNNNINYILSDISNKIYGLYKENKLNNSNLSIDNILSFEGYTSLGGAKSLDENNNNFKYSNCCSK